MTTKLLAHLATEATETQHQAMLEDDAWYMQEKYDGIRIIGINDGAGPQFTNRDGDPHPVPALIQEFKRLPKITVLDGEWISKLGVYVTYDTMMYASVDARKAEYETRLRVLTDMFLTLRLAAPLVLAYTARTVGEKKALLAKLIAEDAEGVIWRHREAPYFHGRQTVSPSLLKVKFWETCDVIVKRRTQDTTRSFDMWVLADGRPFPVGSVSAYGYYELVPPGKAAIAEVKYLYATKKLELYGPPSILRLRDDKKPEECTISQLKVGKRHKVA